MPLYSPAHTGLEPKATDDLVTPAAAEEPKPARRRKAKAAEPPSEEQPVANDQPDTPDVA